ncbi:MAG: hypothetical protein RBS11_07755 [Sulfurimonas sp.]|jgi:hypothetical protein|nr:hypothetical protein [Sulfurimonas sp.]
MQTTDNTQADKFEIYLDEMILKVQACQKERDLESCSLCDKYLACELRSEYISAVYNSMSKGETGGFEF